MWDSASSLVNFSCRKLVSKVSVSKNTNKSMLPPQEESKWRQRQQ